ncbi:MAG TPA: Crp/Fnr family transcriptional regulator [Thermoleophilaceae bacterium]|nr:Crp/Fnr family transcriptional regulator [Thermoleophilaceae bacterium]
MADQRRQTGGIGDRVGSVNVLRADPDLARGLVPAEARRASRRAVAGVVSLPKGVFWPQERLPSERGTLGMLLVDGMLLRGVAVTDRPTVELMGPGDLFRPFEPEPDPDATVSGEVRWWALTPARVAVLDAAFIRRMSDHPTVVAELAGRLSRRSAASSLRLAIVQEPRLSLRLHAVLWQLADRFGEPQAEGMLLRAPLCHVLLSWLVGARRPAMSRAINELERAGRLARRPDGTWWLGRQRPEGFADPPLAARRVAA